MPSEYEPRVPKAAGFDPTLRSETKTDDQLARENCIKWIMSRPHWIGTAQDARQIMDHCFGVSLQLLKLKGKTDGR